MPSHPWLFSMVCIARWQESGNRIESPNLFTVRKMAHPKNISICDGHARQRCRKYSGNATRVTYILLGRNTAPHLHSSSNPLKHLLGAFLPLVIPHVHSFLFRKKPSQCDIQSFWITLFTAAPTKAMLLYGTQQAVITFVTLCLLRLITLPRNDVMPLMRPSVWLSPAPLLQQI